MSTNIFDPSGPCALSWDDNNNEMDKILFKPKYGPVWQRSRLKTKFSALLKKLMSCKTILPQPTAEFTEESKPDHRFVILPSDSFNIFWSVILVFLLLSTTIIVPYFIAFATINGYDACFYANTITAHCFSRHRS